MELKRDLHDAVDSIKTFHKQQQQLYNGFKILRGKYDDLKQSNTEILWEYIPTKIKTGYEEVGQCDLAIFETCDRIGPYQIGAMLGEGQFADVKMCSLAKKNSSSDLPQSIQKKSSSSSPSLSSSPPLAIKIMRKDKVNSVQNLKRINNEISVLRRVRHTNIIDFHDCIISPKMVYIVVAMGGSDLFEFFDDHLDGVDPDDAREVILGITRPINYLHNIGICHRDLKPENILLKTDPSKPVSADNVKICDFGLCCSGVTRNNKGLSEFCGSPGFFAPEILLNGGRYNGLLVDIWSIGCIMLELFLGHQQFCKAWMTAYDYNKLQRESIFEDTINHAVDQLDLSHFGSDIEGRFSFRFRFDFNMDRDRSWVSNIQIYIYETHGNI